MNRFFIFLIGVWTFPLIIFGTPTVRGGVETVTGGEEGLWDANQFSVIVGRLNDIRPDDPLPGPPVEYATTIEPVATIAGHLDVSAHRQLRLRLRAGDATSLAIHFVPKKGNLVLVVVVRDDSIFSDAAMFMPEGVPLVILDGMSDKRIVETLHRLQDAREKGEKARAADAAPVEAPAVPSSAPAKPDRSITKPGRQQRG